MPRTSSTPQKRQTSSPVPFQNPLSNVGHPTPSAPSFGQTLKEGFAFGTGSAIAHRIFNPFTTAAVPVQKKIESPCEKERLAFETCMKFKTAEDFCGNEQMGYTQCLRISRGQD